MGSKRYGFELGDPAWIQEMDAAFAGAWAPRVRAMVRASRTFAYFGGPTINLDGTVTWHLNGTIVCPDDTLSVVQRDPLTGVVQTAPVLLSGKIPMAIVECYGGELFHFEDIRDGILGRFGSVAAPTTALSGARQWHEADSLGLTDGDPISTWADDPAISGNGHDLTSSGVNRPVYREEDVDDGLPFLEFDNVADDKRLSITGMTAFTGTELTVYAVLRGISQGGTRGLIALWDGTGDDALATDSFVVTHGSAAADVWKLFRNNVSFDLPHPVVGSSASTFRRALTDWSILVIRWKETLGQDSLLIRVNDMEVTYGDGQAGVAFDIQAAVLGTRFFSSAFQLGSPCGFRAFGWYPEAHNGFKVRHMMRYLANKWAVPAMG